MLFITIRFSQITDGSAHFILKHAVTVQFSRALASGIDVSACRGAEQTENKYIKTVMAHS